MKPKMIIFVLSLLAGCKSAPSACFVLESCKLPYVGLEALCVRGVGSDGKKNGEVHRFLDQNGLMAWSQLHPEATACQR